MTIPLSSDDVDLADSPCCHMFHTCPKSTRCRYWRDGVGCTDRFPENE